MSTSSEGLVGPGPEVRAPPVTEVNQGKGSRTNRVVQTSKFIPTTVTIISAGKLLYYYFLVMTMTN